MSHKFVLVEDAEKGAEDELLVGQSLAKGDIEGILTHVRRNLLDLFSLETQHSLGLYLRAGLGPRMLGVEEEFFHHYVLLSVVSLPS